MREIDVEELRSKSNRELYYKESCRSCIALTSTQEATFKLSDLAQQ